MKTDSDIKRDVEIELKWDPDIDATDIAVSVKNGVVTLTGFARSYIHKYHAERDAKRVAGVVAVANDIEVRLPDVDQRPDPEIAREAVEAIKRDLPVSHKNIKVIVANGWVTLEGQVEWNYQRDMAESAARRVKGVKGVTDAITLKPRVEASEVKRKIEDAFKRSALIDAGNVTVEATGGAVILRGRVRSWAEREEAQRAAYRAPGVTSVDNRITVDPDTAEWAKVALDRMLAIT